MKLFNTLSREKQTLQTLENNKVKLYTCGLTVYSQPHIGNWVSYIYWDILTRILEEKGYEVERVQNITDVGHLVSDDDNGEDKMEKGAKAEGLSAWEIAEKYIKIADSEAYGLLGLKKPKLVRATDYIEQQIDFVRKLEEKGYTYEIPDEGIYFDTSKLSDYGKLARIDVEGLRAGERVAFKNKRSITDFALWKFSPEDKTRDMEWESPWGKGFPGWHLECSAIAYETLGEQIDIHTGGVDHIPIHHTNEIAQTESLTGKQFSSLWVHNNFLKIEGSKMAKSVGNIYTLNDIIAKGYDVMAFKLLVLSKHYKTEGNFSWEILESHQNRLNELKAWADRRHQPSVEEMPAELDELWLSTLTEIEDRLADDLDTPGALVALSKLINYMSTRPIPKNDGKSTGNALAKIDRLLGLQLNNRPDINAEQKKLLTNRTKAREEQNWTTSDEIRDELLEQGIELRDEPFGQVWSRTGNTN